MDELNRALEFQLLVLTRSQPFLRRIGIRDIAERRFKETWHSQPLPAHWGATVGMWGGVETHSNIMKRAGVEYSALKAFRQRHGLTTVTEADKVCARWELAASAYIRWKEGDGDPARAVFVAAHFGILPVELRIYVERLEHVVRSLELEPGAILEPENYGAVQEAWAPHDEAIDGFVLSAYSQIVHG